MLDICVDPDRQVEDADFGARVQADRLHVPQDLGAVLRRFQVRNAEQFVAYLQTFPTAFASELDWNADELEHALRKLLSTLRGHVSDALLDADRDRFEPGYGALPPSRRSHR